MISGRLTLGISADLISDSRLPLAAKALYMTIAQSGACSLQELSAISRVSRETVRRLVGLLVATGWATVGGREKLKVIVATRPKDTQMDLAYHLREVRSCVYPVGETLSKLVLNVEVADDRYVDNARPAFLQNRETGEYMELDRWYYEHRVGEEYEGIQHFAVTKLTDKEKLKEIQARDAMKAEICRAEGIPLMIITEDDLSIDGILAKIPPQLPKAHFDRNDSYVRTLDELCRDYVASCRRARLREAREQARRHPEDSEPDQ